MLNHRLCVLLSAVLICVLVNTQGTDAKHIEANVSMSNVTVIRWILSFGFSEGGLISFNATPDQDIENYYSNFSILICNETESDEIIYASAKQLCHRTCASHFKYDPLPKDINLEWNSPSRDYYNMFFLNLDCTEESGSLSSSQDPSEPGLNVVYHLNFTLDALNLDTDYPHLSLENVGNPKIMITLLVVAAIAFGVCILQSFIRSYILFVRNSRWREILYEEKRFHYGVCFLCILFFICLQAVCLYSFWMEYASVGSADIFVSYFGHLFGAIAHAASLGVIEMWVFGRTKPKRASASISSSVESAMGSKLHTFSVWCFLLVACIFYSFYESSTRAWASTIMASALLVWMIKPMIRIIEQVYELTAAVRPGSSHEQKQLLSDDGDSKKEADAEEEEEEEEEVPAAKEGSNRASVWRALVLPFFANPWPIIFIIFGLSEMFWIILPTILPWYLSFFQFQPFLPIILSAISSIFVFESYFSRPGPPKDHPAPM